MINIIKNLIKKEKEINLLKEENVIKRLELIAQSISKKKIEIIESNDKIGGYYENKIILPKNINEFETKEKNIKLLIYRTLFSACSKKLNLYLPENKKEINYLFIASMITVKQINKLIKKLFKQSKNIIKETHTKNNSINKNKKNFFYTLIKKKLMYERIRGKNESTKNEKILLYTIENIKILKKENFKKNINKIYNDILKIYNINENISLNPIWGYLYYKENTNEKKNIKKTIIKKKKIKNEKYIKKNIKKYKKKKVKKNEINNLSYLFNYKKTIDKYKKGEKNTTNNNDDEDNNTFENLDLEQYQENEESNKKIIKNRTLNEIKILKLNNKSIKIKKYTYKEWDFKNKKYKKNWCNVFIKKEQNIIDNKKYIKEIKKKYKKEIKIITEKINNIKNESYWKKKQIYGEDIDLDVIIDNYKDIKKGCFSKYYKYKKKYIKNIKITILLDESSSTDSYVNEKKIIDLIKEFTIIIDSSIKNEIKNYSIASFYSNTRHDCTYKIIKNSKDIDAQPQIINLTPHGYTRIGPAIRHAIKEMEKKKLKKNAIILITDGNPTDYDEYEGEYGINDIKKTILEAKKKNIQLKTIIVNNKYNQEFINIFKKNNFKINENKNISNTIINIIKNIINY